jgi:WD40 repeat protein
MDTVQIKCVNAHSDTIWDARYSPDSALLATASADYTVKIWNTNATPTSQMGDGVGLYVDVHVAAHRLGVFTLMASGWRLLAISWRRQCPAVERAGNYLAIN